MPARTRFYDERDLEMIERAAGMGCTIEQVAHLMGVPLFTFRDHLDKDPKIKDRMDKGRAKCNFEVMKTAYTMAVSGEQPAMTTFWLKTRCNWREAKEILPSDQDSVNKIKNMPTSELIRLVKDKVG